jgi:hypothetical protein
MHTSIFMPSRCTSHYGCWKKGNINPRNNSYRSSSNVERPTGNCIGMRQSLVIRSPPYQLEQTRPSYALSIELLQLPHRFFHIRNTDREPDPRPPSILVYAFKRPTRSNPDPTPSLQLVKKRLFLSRRPHFLCQPGKQEKTMRRHYVVNVVSPEKGSKDVVGRSESFGV